MVKKLEVGAAFVAIGHDPNTKLFKSSLKMDDAGYLFSGTRGSWSGEDTLRNAAVVLGKSKTAQQLATHALTLDIVNRVLSPYAKKVKLGVATRIVKVAAAG